MTCVGIAHSPIVWSHVGNGTGLCGPGYPKSVSGYHRVGVAEGKLVALGSGDVVASIKVDNGMVGVGYGVIPPHAATRLEIKSKMGAVLFFIM